MSLSHDAVCADRERIPRFVAISGCRGVLLQPHVVDQDVARHRSSRILIAGILIVDAEGDARVERYVGENDLVAAGWHRLKGNTGEVSPARMNVGRTDPVDARLR